MSRTYALTDPFDGSRYDYTTRDAKEDALYAALNHVLRDECPPDKRDYLCMSDESEEQRCEDCWLRWATRNFGETK